MVLQRGAVAFPQSQRAISRESAERQGGFHGSYTHSLDSHVADLKAMPHDPASRDASLVASAQKLETAALSWEDGARVEKLCRRCRSGSG